MNDVSSRVQTAALRLYPIEVVLPSRPPCRHVMTRGLGPALAPLHITPEDDSTARISNKEIWHDLTQTGTTKVQLYYIVQWTDLPGASVLVQADKILDYVSPRTVEDFEYKLSLERDAAAERLREELELAKQIAREEEILRHEVVDADTTPSDPNKTSAKRPGRPSKADILRREAEKAQADFEVLLPSVGSAASGPSLSTPQKSQKVPTDTLDVEDDVEEYDAAEHHHHKVYAANPVAAWNSRSVHSQSSPATRSPRKARSVASGGFTPAARSSGRWPSKSPRVAEASSPSILAHSIAKASRKKGKGKGKGKGKETGESLPLPEEPEYVIECIEDQQMFKVKGQEKPYYLVRWEGNWPPDQNPTWEPAENLPTKMIQKFLRKKAQMDIGRYSSVADAFEGDLEEAAGEMDYYSSDENQDADMEEMLLVEEGEAAADPFLAKLPSEY